MLPFLNFEQRHSLQSSLKPTSETLRTELFHKFNSPFELHQVHSLVIKTETPLSALPLSRVASVCALTPNFPYARRIYQLVDQPEISLWNSCLRDFAESDSPFDAILLFHQLRRHNLCPDSFTCSFVLKACVQLLDLSHGRIIHAFVEKLELQFNLVLQNVILNLYASCGQISDVILLFNKMPQRDTVTWNTMITQLVKRVC
ncbi:UNVERIFIED_CONTAM: Pentatricopeptide repeat-containing protein [Sesamum latifolium]|uniref:Pentatricopeptide repeat-containing protein n=1 Tax=Sesamum latifolium TaxID=2727402 RepID=A0AAW2XGR8_9LAMI